MEENSQKNVVNNFAEGSNCQVFNGNITGCTFAMPGSTVYQQPVPQQPSTEQSDDHISLEALVAGIKRTKAFMWGNAAYAVAFCVCRDKYGVGDNATAFERMLLEQGISIPAGTINAALHRNPWMRYHVDSWDGRGVQRRAFKLRDEVQNQIANL